jgi:hypothetical protein
MPRNITVTFNDGSTHVYQNAPDDLTPAQVTERAQKEFGKSVTALDGGKGQPSGIPVGRQGETAITRGLGISADPLESMLQGLSSEQLADVARTGAGVAAGMAAGPVLGAGLRYGGATIPAIRGVTGPLATAIESGGFRTGLQTGTPRIAQTGMRMIGGAVPGGIAAGVVNPEDAGFGAVVGGLLPSVAAPVAGRIVSVVGSGIDALMGTAPMVRAGRVVRTALGDQANALRALLSGQPQGLPAETALTLKDAAGREMPVPLFQALVQKAESLDPVKTNWLLRNRQGEDLVNELNALAGGSTQTVMRGTREATQKALTEQTTPMREQALATAQKTGEVMPRLEQIGKSGREQASTAVENVRRAEQMRLDAEEWAKNWAPGGARQAGAPRGPTKFTYPGELAGRAERFGQQQADESLVAGDKARRAEALLQTLRDQGLEPLSVETFTAPIDRLMRNPEVAINEPLKQALPKIKQMFNDWVDENGIVDANAVNAIRKNGINGIIQNLMPNADIKRQNEMAAMVLRKLRPVIDDAVEKAGGTGWKEYLATYAAGREGIARKELTATLTDLFKNDKARFLKIVEGNDPDFVEGILGHGKYNIAKELANESPALQRAAEAIRRTEKITEQAQVGRAAFSDQQSRDRFYKRLPLFSRASTIFNEVAAALEAKTRDKTMDVLIDAAKSNQKMAEVMDMLPASDRIRVLKVLKTPEDWNKWVQRLAPAFSGAVTAEPRNRLAPENKNVLTIDITKGSEAYQ